MREQYMKALREALVHVNPEIEREIMEDFEAHFDMGLDEGKTEQELADELGDPVELAKQLEEEYGRFETPEKGAEMQAKEKKWYQEDMKENGVDYFTDTEGEIKVLKLDLAIADVSIVPSEDGVFRLVYRNSVNQGIFKKRLRYRTRVFRDTLVVHEEANGVSGRSYSSVEVEVPENFVHIEIKDRCGDIEIEKVDVEADVSVDTVSGDVRIEQLSTGEMRLCTVSGDIRIDNLKTEMMRAKSVSGDVHLEDSKCENTDCESVSGDLSMIGFQAKRMDFSTKSGDVELNLIGEEGYEVVAESLSGDVEMPRRERTSGLFVGGKYRGMIGNGEGRVYVKTLSGDIVVTE